MNKPYFDKHRPLKSTFILLAEASKRGKGTYEKIEIPKEATHIEIDSIRDGDYYSSSEVDLSFYKEESNPKYEQELAEYIEAEQLFKEKLLKWEERDKIEREKQREINERKQLAKLKAKYEKKE